MVDCLQTCRVRHINIEVFVVFLIHKGIKPWAYLLIEISKTLLKRLYSLDRSRYVQPFSERQGLIDQWIESSGTLNRRALLDGTFSSTGSPNMQDILGGRRRECGF